MGDIELGGGSVYGSSVGDLRDECVESGFVCWAFVPCDCV